MLFEDERYVRMYVRDTPDLLAIGWEGRAVWWELLRKADRCGVIDNKRGDESILCDMLRLPVEVFAIGWARVVERGMVEVGDDAILIPNYVRANETPATGRLRMEEFRGRRRDHARRARVSDTTPRDDSLPLRDDTSQKVTGGDAALRGVTASDSVPYRAVPCRAVPDRAVPVTPCSPPQAGDGPSPRKARKAKNGKPPADPELQPAIRGFHELFEKRRGVPPTWEGRQIARMSKLVKAAGSAAEVLRRAEIMFRSAPAWPADGGGDLDTLAKYFDRYATAAPRKRNATLSAEDLWEMAHQTRAEELRAKGESE